MNLHLCDICIYGIPWIAVICGFSSAAEECTRACRLKEGKLDCWGQSLDYYSTTMYEAIDHYAATLLYLAKWQHDHNDSRPGEINLLKNASQTRTLKEYVPNDDSARPFSKEDFKAIMKIIQARVSLLEDTYMEEEKVMPHFTCPIPCGYESQVWRYISILLFVILLLSCLAFFMFFRQQVSSRPGHELLLKDR